MLTADEPQSISKREVNGLRLAFAPVAGGVSIVRCESGADVIELPESIGGFAVVGLGERAFSGLGCSRIVCPPTVRCVRDGAFEGCEHLASLVLPPALTELNRNWIRSCRELRELVLPECVAHVDSLFFNGLELTHLVIGRFTRDVTLPRILAASLERIDVARENPWLWTDGVCLYTRDRTTLLCCAVHVTAYRVAAPCKRIAAGAFAYNAKLEHVELPGGLVDIGDHAFTGCGLTSLELPGSVRSIGPNAFARNLSLRSVRAEAGLVDIGECAFIDCGALERVQLPATIERIDSHAFLGSRLVASGDHPTLVLDPACPHVSIDRFGLLYQLSNGVKTLTEAYDRTLKRVRVAPGTVAIAPRVFSCMPQLEQVELPCGLLRIGDKAFSNCSRLSSVNLPRTLRFIGAEAFRETDLQSVELPESLEYLGECAFLNRSRTRRPAASPWSHAYAMLFPRFWGADPSYACQLSSQSCLVGVSAANARFSETSGMLCERRPEGMRVLAYCGESRTVSIPREATAIAACAFRGVRGIEEIRLHARIGSLGPMGLAMAEPPRRIVVDLDASDACGPLGDAHLAFEPACDDYGLWAFHHAFNTKAFDLALLAYCCDRTLLHLPRGYERARRIVDRIADGRYLDAEFADPFRDEVVSSLDEVCGLFAAHNHCRGFQELVDVGIIDGRNVGRCIDAATDARGVEATGYLLNVKHRRFAPTCLDFEV